MLVSSVLGFPSVSRPSIDVLSVVWLLSGRVGAALGAREGGLGSTFGLCYDPPMRLVSTTLLVSLVMGTAGCSVPWVSPAGEGTPGAQEWQGQIVQLDRDQGYMVVRSSERLLDYVFLITLETEITSKSRVSPPLERGQWVTVVYRRESSDLGPPVALRVVVIR